jgi:hypothetical protein
VNVVSANVLIKSLARVERPATGRRVRLIVA